MWLLSLGEMGDAFDAADFHREASDDVGRKRADRIGADPGMDIDVVEADAGIDVDELVQHWDWKAKRQADDVDHEIMQIVGALGGSAANYQRER